MSRLKAPVIEDRWVVLGEFPDYEINQNGEIFNRRTQSIMRTSFTNHGHMKITLMKKERVRDPETQEVYEVRNRYTRSVALLVADAFVRPPHIFCDAVILLDGDFANVSADNLMWRPQGFSYKYIRQLKMDQPPYYLNLPVLNTETGDEYTCVVHAGMTEGLLFDDIWRSTYTGARLFPNGSAFRVI